MEPEPNFDGDNHEYIPFLDELKNNQEIEELYNKTNIMSKKLFDILLEEKKEWADAESCAMKEESMEGEEIMRQGRKTGCKCSKIGCLKLYCECFANGLSCTDRCSCSCCRNKPGHENDIYQAKMLANYRHPGTFKGIPAYQPSRKCTCKKSKCIKKYCQCFSAGLKCNQFCQCKNCQNCQHHEQSNNFFQKDASMIQIEVNA